MFGAVPANLILEVGKSMGVMSQEELPLDLPIWVFVKPEYLTCVSVELKHYDSSGRSYGALSHIDHPSFTETREFLESKGFIQIERTWWNGDRVLKPFYFNNVLMLEGAQFSCASAMKYSYSEKYNDGKILEGVRNYESED